MTKIIVFLAIVSNLMAVSYNRDIQPMIDFRKKQEQTNRDVENRLRELERENELLIRTVKCLLDKNRDKEMCRYIM